MQKQLPEAVSAHAPVKRVAKTAEHMNLPGFRPEHAGAAEQTRRGKYSENISPNWRNQ
jgi:hypothetical protein